MSILSDQFEIGVSQSMTHLGVSATYRSVSSGKQTTLNVILTAPEYQVTEDQSVMAVASNRWDVLLSASDLEFNDAAYEPRPNDRLTINGITYVVTIDEMRNYCWTWEDKYRIRRRLFTKITTGE